LREGFQDEALGVGDQVAGEMVEDVPEGLVEFERGAGCGMLGIHLVVEIGEERNTLAKGVEVEQIRFEGVVEVGGVVGNLVHPVDELRFEGRAQVEKVFGEFGKFGGSVVAGMLDDAFADLEGEIEARKGKIAMLEVFDDAEGMEVVIEAAAVRAHEFIKFAFAGVTEGWMANVMDQGQGFDEIGVQAKGSSDRAGDL